MKNRWIRLWKKSLIKPRKSELRPVGCTFFLKKWLLRVSTLYGWDSPRERWPIDPSPMFIDKSSVSSRFILRLYNKIARSINVTLFEQPRAPQQILANQRPDSPYWKHIVFGFSHTFAWFTYLVALCTRFFAYISRFTLLMAHCIRFSFTFSQRPLFSHQIWTL